MSQVFGKGSNKSVSGLVIGGPARADLLPPEVAAAAQGRALRVKAVAIIVVAILAVVLGYAGAMVLTMASQAELEAAKQETLKLVQEQSKYIEVKQVVSMLDNAEAGQRVGTSTEIDWKTYLDDIQKSLPSGTVVTNFRAETATPVTAFGQPSIPLRGDRIGELTFTATSAGLPDVQAWLVALAKLHGFVDAAPGSITFETQKAVYVVSITMHIDNDALLLRFDQKAKEAQTQARKDREATKSKAEPVAPTQPSESPAPPQETPEPSPSDNTDGGQ